MKLNTTPFFDYQVYSQPLENLPLDQKLLINTVNQYSYCVAKNDLVFKKALLDSDVLLPDGVAVVAAVRLINGKKIDKIAGADLHEFLLQKLSASSGSCFYLGASETTLQKIKERLASSHPNITVNSFSPPYKPEFTADETAEMIQAVNSANPDVLFVGMTAPKQEKWALQHFGGLNATTICTIGAVFDFYAGTVSRPSKIWIDLGLEWLVRLLKEPKRLWKRYLYYGPVFLWDLAKAGFTGR